MNAVVNSMAEGLAVVDDRGRWLLRNPAATRVGGLADDLRVAAGDRARLATRSTARWPARPCRTWSCGSPTRPARVGPWPSRQHPCRATP